MTTYGSDLAVNFSLACLPARSPVRAMTIATETNPSDPLFGALSLGHVQVCPQNCIGIFDEQAAAELRGAFPDTRFRLHANVRIDEKHKPDADLSAFRRYRGYFMQLALVSQSLGADAYTLHAGQRSRTEWIDLMLAVDQIEDWFGIPVGIEGHYPTPGAQYWLNSWSDYKRLLESGKRFALDLSHLNILAVQSGKFEHQLVREMLSSENCIEVHFSHNNGRNDQHVPMDADNPPWWVAHADAIHEKAVIFYEGNLIKKRIGVSADLL